jgi:hypothetical protein
LGSARFFAIFIEVLVTPMKNLRVLFIIAFVVFVFASCEKSETKPKCSHSSSTTEQQPTTGDQNVSGRIKSSASTSGTPVVTETPNPLDIVGGGDDDRDGGDRKKTVGK